MKEMLQGNYAVAYGVKLSRIDVVSAYPITPQTSIIEKIGSMCDGGEMEAQYIKVESEHSAMAACIGASAAGARAFTATSSQGLLLMHELLHWAARGRLPIVMANVNRGIAPPWNIQPEQNDSLSQRDTGWLQFYCEDNQEVLDTVIQAFKIAETVQLPCMIVLDAFFLSHFSEPVDIPEIEEVDRFLPPREAPYKLDVEEPRAFYGGTADSQYLASFTYKLQMAMEESVEVAERVDKEFGEQFGRYYGIVDTVHCQDADLIIVSSGSMTSTIRFVVESLRKEGTKVGLLKIKMFRPFPIVPVGHVLARAPKVAVLDRNISFGHGGIFAQEIKSSLYNLSEKPVVFSFISGLGGIDVTEDYVRRVVDYALNNERPDQMNNWMEVIR